MSDTHRPATGSKKGKPAIAPPIPASATTLDSASLRWWWALAIRTSLRARAPTFTVARNSASLDTSDTSAAASAIEPGRRRGGRAGRVGRRREADQHVVRVVADAGAGGTEETGHAQRADALVLAVAEGVVVVRRLLGGAQGPERDEVAGEVAERVARVGDPVEAAKSTRGDELQHGRGVTICRRGKL